MGYPIRISSTCILIRLAITVPFILTLVLVCHIAKTRMLFRHTRALMIWALVVARHSGMRSVLRNRYCALLAATVFLIVLLALLLGMR